MTSLLVPAHWRPVRYAAVRALTVLLPLGWVNLKKHTFARNGFESFVEVDKCQVSSLVHYSGGLQITKLQWGNAIQSDQASAHLLSVKFVSYPTSSLSPKNSWIWHTRKSRTPPSLRWTVEDVLLHCTYYVTLLVSARSYLLAFLISRGFPDYPRQCVTPLRSGFCHRQLRRVPLNYLKKSRLMQRL